MPAPTDALRRPAYPVVLPAAELAAACGELAAAGAQLLTLFGANERGSTGEFGVYAAFLTRDGSTLAMGRAWTRPCPAIRQ